jgi:hypothetical protein
MDESHTYPGQQFWSYAHFLPFQDIVGGHVAQTPGDSSKNLGLQTHLTPLKLLLKGQLGMGMETGWQVLLGSAMMYPLVHTQDWPFQYWLDGHVRIRMQLPLLRWYVG